MHGSMVAPRIAIVGHVEHVTLGRISGIPGPGDILYLREPCFLPGGGGGIAFAQLCRSEAEIHLYTAVGSDEAGRAVAARLASAAPRIHIHAVVRAVAHPRVVVMIDDNGQRTIVVTESPLQPAASDPLPWSILASCDAVYFTGADPETLRYARAARRLVVTARRSSVIRAAAVVPDVIIGSCSDPRENAPFATYEPRPGALVLTDGPRAIRIFAASGPAEVDPPPAPVRVVGDYGAGDSFAGALTYFLAHGLSVAEACRRAGLYGAAVLRGVSPLEMQLALVAPQR